MRARVALAVASLLAGSVFAGPAQSQSGYAVLPVQSLRFGTLTPGLPTAVSSADGGRRAAIEVSGRGLVTVRFSLPGSMRSGTGALLPLQFGPADGQVMNVSNGQVTVFDPRQEHRFTVGGSAGRAVVYLGGTAQPAIGQAPGSYEGEITVTVTISSGNT